MCGNQVFSNPVTITDENDDVLTETDATSADECSENRKLLLIIPMAY